MRNGKQLCKVCNEYIGLLGWARHVAKEKRIHGDDIYKVMSGTFVDPLPKKIQRLQSKKLNHITLDRYYND